MRSAYLICLLGACSFEHGARSGDGDGGVDTLPGDWWNSAWSARMPLKIKNPSTTATLPAGYQVGFPIQVSTAPCTGPNDVRVVYRKSTELERVVDVVGTSTVWFKLMGPLAPGAEVSTDYEVYCGNPAPSAAPSDPKAVFEFFDGFDAALDSTVWTTKATAVPTNGSLVVGNGAQTDNGVVSVAKYTAGYAMDFIAQPSQATNGSFWAGFQNGTMDIPPFILWWTNTSTIIGPAFKVNGPSEDWRGMSKPLEVQPHQFSIENCGDHAIFRYDNTFLEAHTYDVAPPASFSLRLWNYNITPTVSYDMVRVRQVVDPAPMVTVGAVEMR